MSDQEAFERKVEILRLAQSLADTVRASEISPADWKAVVRFLEALLSKTEFQTTGGEAGEDQPGKIDDL